MNSQNSQNTKCNQDLLISYGMEGLEYPQPLKLDMCKFVKNSCCKVADQLTMYSNWQTSAEAKNLKERFRYHRETYFDLVDLLDDIGDLAERILERLHNRRVSNCKVLAKRILHFRVKEITPKLKDAIENMHEFFFNSYQGFYCTICDGDSQKLFQEKAQKVIFSEKFCRDITANSLHVLLYFHVHFLKYMNLVARFVSSCDHKGNFSEEPIDPQLIFAINNTRANVLEECKMHRNDGNWFEFCHKICEEFNIVKYTKFFEPNVKEFAIYTTKIKEEVEQIEEDEEKEAELMAGAGHHRLLEAKKESQKEARKERYRQRILNANAGHHGAHQPESQKAGTHNAINSTSLAAVKELFTDPLIFKSGLNAIVDLTFFKSRFDDPGIDMLDNGKQSFIDDGLYKSVRSITKMNSKESRNLMNSWIFGTSLVLIIFAFY